MKAVRLHAHGGPDALVIEDLPDPSPGPGEVLVTLTARGINRAEILMVLGRYARLPDLPAIPGREGAGVIAALGAEVHGLTPGDRVMLRNGTAIGSGTWCEKVCVRAQDVFPTPQRLDDAQAGGAFVSYLTAWICLVEVMQLQAGQVVVLTAATSPTGLAALDICRHLGLRAIATTRRPDRVDALEAAGAEHVVVEGQGGLVLAAREMTGGEGADAALDAVSGATGRACVKALREGGQMVMYGALSLETLQLDPGALIFGQRRVEGFWLTRALESWPRSRLDAIYDALMQHFASGALTPRVHRCHPLEKVQDAIQEMNSMAHLGKVVLVS
ncbi:MAG: zinc-binding dehydrogenase [Pseudomonadota bacterium]